MHHYRLLSLAANTARSELGRGRPESRPGSIQQLVRVVLLDYNIPCQSWFDLTGRSHGRVHAVTLINGLF